MNHRHTLLQAYKPVRSHIDRGLNTHRILRTIRRIPPQIHKCCIPITLTTLGYPNPSHVLTFSIRHSLSPQIFYRSALHWKHPQPLSIGVSKYILTLCYITRPRERPAYRSYWDPSVSGGRWSHLPTRVHFALRRIFASPINASFVRKNRR